jgi:flagellar motor switch protein FliM
VLEDDAQLTQEETSAIADLLRQGLPEPEEATMVGPTVRGPAEPIVLRYDLVAGARRKGDDLPGLQLVHERYATELGSEFRRALGTEGTLLAERVSYAKFAELYARLTVPTAILIANLVGVGCSVIISMEPRLAMHFFDLLMGGEGGLTKIRGDLASRGFTQAEKGVMKHLLGIFARALKTAWSDIAEVDLDLLRVASDPRHAAIYEPSEAMAELVVHVEWGTVEGSIRMAIPTSFLGQYDDVLSRTATPNHLKAESVNIDSMRHNLMPVEVGLSVILGRADMTVEKLLSLAVGDVVRLDADPDEPIIVCVEDVPKIIGYPTVQRGNVAVRVADFIGSGDAELEGQDHARLPR